MFIGLGSFGLMSLLTMTSLGIPLFFARRGEYSFGKTVAPGLGGVAVALCTGLAAMNYSILTGVDNKLINSLPWVLVGIVQTGFLQALLLRKHDPKTYARIGASRIDEPPLPH